MVRYLFSLFMIISVAVQAQTLTAVLKENFKLPPPSPPASFFSTDTLSQYFDRAKGATLFNAQGGGYVFGTSYYFQAPNIVPVSDETGLHYDGVANAFVTELLFWAGSTTINGTADNITGNVYSAGADSMPLALLSSGTVNMNDILPSTSLSFSSVSISPPANTNGNPFFVSLGYLGVDDTLGLVSSNSDSADGNGEKRVRQLANSNLGGGWRRMGELYSYYDLDVFIIPVVAISAVGVDTHFDFQDVSLDPVFPVPASSGMNLSYRLKKPAKISHTLFDIHGRTLSKKETTFLTAGKYTEQIDISSLAPGKYYLTFICNGSRVTQSVIVGR